MLTIFSDRIFLSRAIGGKLLIRVCVYPRTPKNDNPFLYLLKSNLAREMLVIDGKWRNLITKRYDVLLVNWPESLIRGKNIFISLIKLFAISAVLVKSKATKTKIVNVIHNIEPHEKSNFLERCFLKFWNKISDGNVYLHPDRELNSIRDRVIYHGSYLPLIPTEKSEGLPKGNQLISFGHIRRYKNLEMLVTNFEESIDGNLLIVGATDSQEYLDSILKLANGRSNVTIKGVRLSDSELIDEICSSQIAIFAHQSIYNSGAILFALSCRRPVIATRSNSMQQLQTEIGKEWLYLIEGDITSEKVSAAIAFFNATKYQRKAAPKFMKERDWGVISKAYLTYFVELTKI